MTYYIEREAELAVQEEVTYGTSPGALAGADFFKHTSGHEGFTPELSTLPRDRDKDFQQGSVLLIQTGRTRSQVSVEGDVIPSGNATTPTPPDADLLYKAAFRNKFTCTAHTTTAAGSTGTTLNLTGGGGAASGIRAGGGDLIAVDVDTTNGYEVRRVVSRATDVVTIDRAFTANPATARTVKVGTTYYLSSTALVSLYFWLYNQNVLRYAVPGCVLNDFTLDISGGDDVSLLKAKWAGMGMYEIAQATSRPTPVTAGVPVAGQIGKIWVGAVRYNVVSANLSVKSGLELRESEINSLNPTGVKFTGNGSRFEVMQTLDMLMSTSTDPDVQALYDGSKTLTTRDTIVQIGSTPGQIVAWCTPKWQPTPPARNAVNGEVGISLTGRCIGTVGDDEVYLAFI